jgi:hypothetical protein
MAARTTERRRLGTIGGKRKPEKSHWLDRAYASVIGRPRFFGSGWGDPESADAFVRALLSPPVVYPIQPTLKRAKSAPGTRTYTGTFESPAAELMPAESRVAHFELSMPADLNDAPICVILAATGEEGYARRRRCFLPLTQMGLGVLFLENPYYGVRRPAGQRGSDLRTVSDLFVMCRATCEEAVSILGWLGEEGHPVLGVAGYSMGGSMAALTAVRTPFPLAVVLGATGLNGASILSRDLLSRQVRWPNLGVPEAAREKLGHLLARLSLDRLPPPLEPSSAILVGCTRDGYVDKNGIQALNRLWAGSELRWIETGHVGGITFHSAALRQAIADAFRLRRQQYRQRRAASSA